MLPLALPVIPMALVASVAAVAPADGVVPVVRVVAEVGDVAPDGNGRFLRFGNPILNDAGQVAFTAELAGTAGGDADARGLFRVDPSADGADLVQLARSGQLTPDGDGLLGTVNINISLNDAGAVAFRATIVGDGPPEGWDNALYVASPANGLSEVGREGRPLPGVGTFGALPVWAAINNAGTLAFPARLAGDVGGNPLTRAVLFRADPGRPPEPAVRGGDPAPGQGVFVYFSDAAVNDAGQIAFAATLLGDAPALSAGVFRVDDGTVVSLARTGQPAPDGEGGFAGTLVPPRVSSTFAPRPVSLNAVGTVAFTLGVDLTGDGQADLDGLFAADGDRLAAVARVGQPAPGTGGAVFAGNLFGQINDAGQIAFSASLDDGPPGVTGGLFRGDGDAVVAVAVEGAPAPRVGGGTRGTLTHLETFAINDAGQIAFFAYADLGDGGLALDDAGVFLYDDALGLVAVAREGDPLLGSVLTDVRFFTGSADHATRLNDRGSISIEYALADGRRGVAVVSVPEPAAASALTAAGLAVHRKRGLRRR